MKTRKWSNLSANYRKRLQRAGVTKRSYESGISLKIARGHAKKVRAKKVIDPVKCPGESFVRKPKKIHWYDTRKEWLTEKEFGDHIDEGYCPPHLPEWWLIFS